MAYTIALCRFVELAFTGFCWAGQEQLHLHSAQLLSHICFCARPSCRLTVACALDRVALSQLHLHSAQSLLHSAQFLSDSCICTRPSCFLTAAGVCVHSAQFLSHSCICTRPSCSVTAASALGPVASALGPVSV